MPTTVALITSPDHIDTDAALANAVDAGSIAAFDLLTTDDGTDRSATVTRILAVLAAHCAEEHIDLTELLAAAQGQTIPPLPFPTLRCADTRRAVAALATEFHSTCDDHDDGMRHAADAIRMRGFDCEYGHEFGGWFHITSRDRTRCAIHFDDATGSFEFPDDPREFWIA
jgi:hypothetical protein